jgi:hypothetical protein
MQYMKPAILNEVAAVAAVQGGFSQPKGTSCIDNNAELESANPGYEADE